MQAAVKLTECPVAPQSTTQRFFRYDFTRRFEQNEQKLERKLLNSYPLLIAQQKAFSGPNLKSAKPIPIASRLDHFGRNNAYRITKHAKFTCFPSA
jgi:hypothetical protein